MAGPASGPRHGLRCLPRRRQGWPSTRCRPLDRPRHLGRSHVRHRDRSLGRRGRGQPPAGCGDGPRAGVATRRSPELLVNSQSVEGHVRHLGPLAEELRHRIRTTGPVPFESYMRLALYHPTDGYYATRVPGHGADYRTSPSISPWFGRLVGRALRHMWEDLGRPDPFRVIEVGAGLGDLAAGAMEAAGPMAGALRWRFVELFDRVAGWQRRRLGSAAALAEWTPELGGAAPVCGCILANEVLDAFPVHVLEVAGDGDAREVCVGLDGDRFVEVLGPLSTASLDAASRRAAACLQVGSRFEVCLELDGWFARASRALERGYL